MLVCDCGIFHQNGGGDGSMVVVMVVAWWLSSFQAGIAVNTMVVAVVGVITCYPCQHGDSSDNACLIIITMELIKLIDVVGVMFMIAVIVDMVWVARWPL